MHRFSLGVDPEVFVFDKNKKKFVSPHKFSTGTKKKPEQLRGYDLQVDGMALEYNSRPIIITASNRFLLKQVRGPVSLIQRKLGSRYKIIPTPTADFDDEEWHNAPDENKILGCNPDMNAWTLAPNPTPDGDVKFRSGAGHIHIGWGYRFQEGEQLNYVCAQLTKELDAHLGVASILFDGDTRRRTLYGKAGAFRAKPYGVEYRTLSNAWLRSPSAASYVIGVVKDVVSRMLGGDRRSTDEVQGIINNNKTAEAVKFLSDNNMTLPPTKERID
jgi:hypothetical protein